MDREAYLCPSYWEGKSGPIRFAMILPLKKTVKSTAVELFSFPTDCEGKRSDLDRRTYVEVPLQVSDHKFVGNSLSLPVLCPTVHGCLGTSKEKRCRWFY